MNSTTPDQRVRTTILSAPQGWGKTRNAEALRREHKCRSVVDAWWPGQPLKPGALHLTSCPPPQLPAASSTVHIACEGWA